MPTKPLSDQTISRPNQAPPADDKLSLSATQLIASALAAVSASVAASVFGVAGTVIGAALGSVISVIGSAVYAHSIRRTRRRVLGTVELAVGRRFDSDPARLPLPTPARPAPAGTGRRSGWGAKHLALLAGGLFAVTMAAVTGFELASGQPVSATVTHNQGTGATLFGGSESTKAKSSTPAPSSTAATSTAVSSSAAPTSGSTTPSSSTATSSQAATSPSATATPSASASPSAPAASSAAPAASAASTASTP